MVRLWLRLRIGAKARVKADGEGGCEVEGGGEDPIG